jgi:hypothetical protein
MQLQQPEGHLRRAGARNLLGLHSIRTQEQQVVRHAPPFTVSQIKIQIVKGSVGAFKLETFKSHDKSFQNQECVKANNGPLVPEATPLVTCVINVDAKRRL